MRNLRFPANAMLINREIIGIANLEPFPFADFYEFPETEPFSLNFEQCGIKTNYFLDNMGFKMCIIYANLALLPLYFILLKMSYCAPKIKRLSNYVETYLFWNGTTRLYIELYQDFALNSSLSLYKVERDSSFEDVRLSNIYAFISFTLICAIPIVFFLPYYCFNKARWFDESFQSRYGELLDATSKKTRFATMAYPMIFLIRRLAFVASALFLDNYLIAQICIYIGMSMATIFLINLFDALETR